VTTTVLFDVYDNDKNGFISFEEFIQVFKVISGIQSTPETKDKIYQEIQSKWTLWAKANPTKGLNMTEFQQVVVIETYSISMLLYILTYFPIMYSC
jgi:Ca2+-binding EF-hand superfamily protein